MTERDQWGRDLDALLARFQTSADAVFEREQDERDAMVDDAIWEVEHLTALMDRQKPNPLTRSRL